METSKLSSGVAAGLGSYVLWGFLPAYFILLKPTSAWEIVAWRISLSFLFCLVLLVFMRQIRSTFALLRDRGVVWMTVLAGVLIYVNWQVFLLATLNGHIVESALGYFINPIVTILIGVFALGEKLRPMQWVAIGMATVAVVVLVVGYGSMPWYGLTLAASFGSYGFVKKKLGGRVGAVAGLTFESMWLLPIAVIELYWVATTSGLSMFSDGVWHGVALAMAGAVTAVPLILFSRGAALIPLSWMGFMQYITPSMQFAFGVFVMMEPMPPERLVGFVLVWIGLIALMADNVVASRKNRHNRAAV